MKKDHKRILELDNLDPLAEAERLTGVDYKKDDETTWLGMAIMLEKSKKMNTYLDRVGDTKFSNKVDDYLNIATSFGFDIAYTEPFEYEGYNESLFVLFHEELGIVLNFDTWSRWGDFSVNGGNFYYNWSPFKRIGFTALTSSGHYWHPEKGGCIGLLNKNLETSFTIDGFPSYSTYESVNYEEYRQEWDKINGVRNEMVDRAINEGKRIVWIGDHDCREALITHIKALYENGTFLKKWVDCQFPWLTHYGEMKKNDCSVHSFKDYYTLTYERLRKMDDKVRKCVNDTYNKK